MKRPGSVQLAVAIVVTTLCIYGLLLIPFLVIPAIHPEFQRYDYWDGALFIIPSYAIVGLLITTRRPGHPIGWMYMLAALAAAAQAAGGQYATTSLTTQTIHLPGGDWAAWIAQLSQGAVSLSILFLLLLFPTGRLLSGRWRFVGWSLTAGVVIHVIVLAFHVRQLEGYPYSNPAGLPALTGVLEVIADIGTPFIIIGSFGTVAMLIVRAFQSRGLERQQIKWFVSTVVFVISMFFWWPPLINFLASILPGVPLDLIDIVGNVWAWGPASFAVVTALSILRYRLFDIDLIIRRTLVYSTLIALLTLVYFGSVAVLNGLLTAVTGPRSQLATVLSTLAIAALFIPLRRRVQVFIDRRFYRQKYDAERTLADFSAAVRDEVDLANLTERLTTVVQETLQPDRVSLWLKIR